MLYKLHQFSFCYIYEIAHKCQKFIIIAIKCHINDIKFVPGKINTMINKQLYAPIIIAMKNTLHNIYEFSVNERHSFLLRTIFLSV